MAVSKVVTPKRIAASPSLLGTPPQNLSFSPQDDFVIFRGPAEDDRERFNLYRIDLQSMEQHLWIDANDLKASSADVTDLTAEERAQRERRRDFSHGITSFIWRPKHAEILLPIDGQVFLLDLSRAPERPATNAQPLFPDDTRQLAFQCSPDGSKLSFVRDRDLYYLDLDSGLEHRVTEDATDLIQSGLPDFLAAEEMHRFNGHWWSHDGSLLFYTRTDESSVEVSYRMEIDATGANTVAQRYPFAGKNNPIVELWLWDLQAQQKQWLYATDTNDDYLARCFSSQIGTLFLLQDRLQQRLTYHRFGGEDLANTPSMFEEVSSSWVNLNDDFKTCDDLYFTTDEKNGHRQVVAFDGDGEQHRYDCVTHTNQLLYVDRDKIYVTGWIDDPAENHLYEINREKNTQKQLTQAPGWHEIALSHDAQTFIDRYSSDQEPLTIIHTDIARGATKTIYAQRTDPAHPYHEYLPNHVHATFGTFLAEDGQSICYKLTPPRAASRGRHPVVLYVYGGPGAQKVRNEWSPLTVQMFAQHGFGVLEIDNRGSANRGRAFEAPLYQAMGTVEVRDQIAGLKILESIDWADLEKVGVYGHSYGGYMTLMLMCEGHNRFAAGVAVAPVCSWSLYDTHYTERYMATPELNKTGYDQGNVLTHLEKLERPLLLMHGMADDNVLFTNSTMLMAELQRLNKSFDLMTYPGAKHSMQEPEVITHRFTKILDFFRHHLA